MNMYRNIILSLDSNSQLREGEAAAVEEFMRTQYGTLDHLSRDDFRRELRLYLSQTIADRNAWVAFA